MCHTRAALSDVCMLMTHLIRKLVSKEGQLWLRVLEKTLRRENPWTFLQIWKIVELGTNGHPHDLRKHVLLNGVFIGKESSDILEKVTMSPRVTEVRVVRLTVAELGFEKGATASQIYRRAIQVGLKLCPSEVGPQLRLQYKDQPRNEHLHVAMEPLLNHGGNCRIFRLSSDVDGLWLRTDQGEPFTYWVSDSIWIFAGPD